MTNSKIIVVLWVLVFSFFTQQQTAAQAKVSQSVFGNGGASTSNGSNRILGTVGQTVIGPASNASNMSNAGFWYQTADIITSVERIESRSEEHT